MRKLSILFLVSSGAASLAGCCTHRAAVVEAPAVCSPIQCGGCGCPQVSTGVPVAGVPAYDGSAAPVIAAPPPGFTTAPGTTLPPSYSPAPSLGPMPGASAPPSTFGPSVPPATSAPGNLPQ
jgi:hypothetical protein